MRRPPELPDPGGSGRPDPGAHRELARRFDALQPSFGPDPSAYLPALARALTAGPRRPRTLLDLGCGTATTLAGVRAQHPTSRAVGVEVDPVLLELARPTPGVEVVDADITAPDWLHRTGILEGGLDVVLAARVLHYLTAGQVRAVYAGLFRWMRPGGVVVVADRFARFGGSSTPGSPEAPEAPEVLARWASWWRDAERSPGLARAFAERNRRRLTGDGDLLTPVEHLHLLRDVGFDEVSAQVSRTGDGVVLARR